MNILHQAPLVAFLSAALLVGAAACGGTSSPDGHPGTGIVQDVDPAAHEITLDHDEIPGLMMAMTMTFNVAPDVPLEDFAPGAKVDFRVKEEGGVYTVTELRRSGS